MKFQDYIEKLRLGEDLSREESTQAVFAMMEGMWKASQTGEFLIELHRKGETAEEIAGFALAMREKCIRVKPPGIRAIDTCGTGGDKKNTFNISTSAAFVLAGCGIPVVKHGNRAASSQCGSADLLQELKISYRMKPEQIPVVLERTGFVFLFAPDYHPATKSVAAVRRQLGIPTIFNLLGPLTNPAEPEAQVIGVYENRALPLLESALRKLDPEKRVFLIHSSEGFDEATPSAEFLLLSTFKAGGAEKASNFGFPECSGHDLDGGSPHKNASITISVLEGEKGARRDTVLLNAILGYLAYHPGANVEIAKQAVSESIDSGAALQVVRCLQEMLPA